MFKLIILVTVLALAASEEKDWFKGKWLQAVGYPRSTILIPMCDWLEFSPALSTECVCVNKTVPLVAMMHLNQNDARSLPVIMFEGVDRLQETLEQKCKCHNGKEENPIVFRKINENYMVVYERHTPSMLSMGPEPNIALLLLKVVPKLSGLRKVMNEIEDLKNRTNAINCEPNYFVNEFDDLDKNE